MKKRFRWRAVISLLLCWLIFTSTPLSVLCTAITDAVTAVSIVTEPKSVTVSMHGRLVRCVVTP